jgi:DNA-binding MarR family transcriptional regulator
MQGFLHAAGALQARLDAAFAEIELTPARFTVLDQLAAAGEPLPLSELAARSSCVRSNMTQLVDKLEADGLVRRVTTSDDRRNVLAELTPEGKAKRTAGAKVLAAERGRFAAAVGERDRRALERALGALG